MATKRKYSTGDILNTAGFRPDAPTALDLSTDQNGNGDYTVDEGRETKRRRSDDKLWQDADRATRRKQKKLAGSYPALSHSATVRLQSQIKLADVQSLVLYLLADGTGPQWISVRHHTKFDKVVVLMVPGLDSKLFDRSCKLEDEVDEAALNGSALEHADGQASEPGAAPTRRNAQKLFLPPDHYFPSKLATQKLPRPLQPLVEMFTHIWPVKTPGDGRKMHSPMYAILSSPIVRTKEEKKMKGPKPPAEGKVWQNTRTPITHFIASRAELLDNGYAIHPAHLHSESEVEAEAARRYRAVQAPEDGWVDVLDIKSLTDGAAPESEIEAGSILQGRRVLVMDCEMVTTTLERFSLARISLLDWDGNTVLDELVKQPAPVKDYLTPFSGITAEMMEKATLTLPDIQNKLREMLTPQTILVGHSLDSDFRALKMSFPFIVDTALLYPHPKGPPQKSSLKWLSQKYLSREIQKGGTQGHDSVEDALACLDLVKQKCEKGKTWGTSEASGESIFKRLSRSKRHNEQHSKSEDLRKLANGSNESHEARPGRTGAIIDWSGNMHGFGATASVAITCQSDDEVEVATVRCIKGTADGSHDVPDGGADFVFARLRELEFVRGWSAPVQPRLSPDRPQIDRDSSIQKPAEPSVSELAAAVTRTVRHIKSIYDALPPRTAFIVVSGSGNPKEMIRLQAMHAAHKAEFLVKKWDELETKWTDDEEQALKRAVESARQGVGFFAVSEDRENSYMSRRELEEERE